MINRWGKFLVSDPTTPDDGMSLNREEWTGKVVGRCSYWHCKRILCLNRRTIEEQILKLQNTKLINVSCVFYLVEKNSWSPK